MWASNIVRLYAWMGRMHGDHRCAMCHMKASMNTRGSPLCHPKSSSLSMLSPLIIFAVVRLKNNKLLEVALKKTDKQSDALGEFLKRNKLPNPIEDPEDDDNNVFVPNRILNAQKQHMSL